MGFEDPGLGFEKYSEKIQMSFLAERFTSFSDDIPNTPVKFHCLKC